MKRDVLIPEVGESITQGILTLWLKKNDDHVGEGEEIFELETDKATLSVPSPATGILQIIIKEGTEVKVGQVVATIEPVNDSLEKGPLKVKETVTDKGEKVEFQKELKGSPIKEIGMQGTPSSKTIEGLESLEQVTVPKVVLKPQIERTTRVKMTTIRRRTQERLVQALKNSAFVTTFNEVNMSKVTEIRKKYGESFQEKHGVKLGLMSFFVKASCYALARFPEVNAQVEGDEIIYNNFYDIGIAVSIERGLLVPVIRDADKLSFAEIEKTIDSFVSRASEKKLKLDELLGGTFTITNGGIFGSLLSTPIPNPPQSAILGMHTIQKRPVIINDQIAVQPMMYLTLTYDHRIIDGREGVRFLVTIKECIEEPHRLLLDI